MNERKAEELLAMKPATLMATMEAYRKSARFHDVCRSIVAQEMCEASRALDDVERDPYRVREVCDRIAIGVAARVLQTVYENDAEVKFWKDHAERVVANAVELSYLSLKPPPIFLAKTPEEPT